MNWKPMSENPFPWKYEHVIVAVFQQDTPDDIFLLRCVVAEHGAHFEKPRGGFLSIHECGWIPFAWCEDDTPGRDYVKYPPIWTDYLTEAQD